MSSPSQHILSLRLLRDSVQSCPSLPEPALPGLPSQVEASKKHPPVRSEVPASVVCHHHDRTAARWTNGSPWIATGPTQIGKNLVEGEKGPRKTAPVP